MNSAIDDLLAKAGRPALVAVELQGAPGDVLCRQGPPLAAADEAWPHKNGKPLLPVLSIRVQELPFVPAFLQGSEYWTFFIEPETWEQIDRDGSLAIRKYETVNGLQLLAAPPAIKRKPSCLRFHEVVDYPSEEALYDVWADQPLLLQAHEARAAELHERFPCHYGIKLGGYPYLIQPTAFLMTLEPDFQIQIDGSDYFHKGDSGIGYVCCGLTYVCWETM